MKTGQWETHLNLWWCPLVFLLMKKRSAVSVCLSVSVSLSLSSLYHCCTLFDMITFCCCCIGFVIAVASVEAALFSFLCSFVVFCLSVVSLFNVSLFLGMPFFPFPLLSL